MVAPYSQAERSLNEPEAPRPLPRPRSHPPNRHPALVASQRHPHAPHPPNPPARPRSSADASYSTRWSPPSAARPGSIAKPYSSRASSPPSFAANPTAPSLSSSSPASSPTPPTLKPCASASSQTKACSSPAKKIDVVQIWTAGTGSEVTYKGKTTLPKEQVEDFYRRRAHSIESVVQDWLKAPVSWS